MALTPTHYIAFEGAEAAQRWMTEAAVTFVSPRSSHPTGLYSPLTGNASDQDLRYSASAECEHGRLPGDKCPQPASVPGGDNGKRVPNPSRRWDKPYPCPCFGEPRVTPDPFATASGATPSHPRVTRPVGRPRVCV